MEGHYKGVYELVKQYRSGHTHLAGLMQSLPISE
jgi:hypothetical protein